MNNTVSPLLNAKLNNTTNNKTANSSSQTSFASQTNENNGDTFIKRNKKKIIIGSAIGAMVAAVGFVLLAKSGKLGNKCQEFVNNIFHFKDKTNPTSKTIDLGQNKPINEPVVKPQEPIVKPVSIQTAKVEQDFNNMTLRENSKFYKTTPACLDKTSVENDMQLWRQMASEAPTTTPDGIVLNSIDNKYLSKLTPHTYQETSDVYFWLRRYSSGYTETLGIIDDKFGPVGTDNSIDLIQYRNEILPDAKEFFRKIDGTAFTSGVSKDGKACVVAEVFTGNRDHSGRQNSVTVLLKSKDENFTQDQLDFMAMLKNSGTVGTRKTSAISSAFIEEGGGVAYKGDCRLHFNKNTFLSIIQNEANK